MSYLPKCQANCSGTRNGPLLALPSSHLRTATIFEASINKPFTVITGSYVTLENFRETAVPPVQEFLPDEIKIESRFFHCNNYCPNKKIKNFAISLKVATECFLATGFFFIRLIEDCFTFSSRTRRRKFYLRSRQCSERIYFCKDRAILVDFVTEYLLSHLCKPLFSVRFGIDVPPSRIHNYNIINCNDTTVALGLWTVRLTPRSRSRRREAKLYSQIHKWEIQERLRERNSVRQRHTERTVELFYEKFAMTSMSDGRLYQCHLLTLVLCSLNKFNTCRVRSVWKNHNPKQSYEHDVWQMFRFT